MTHQTDLRKLFSSLAGFAAAVVLAAAFTGCSMIPWIGNADNGATPEAAAEPTQAPLPTATLRPGQKPTPTPTAEAEPTPAPEEPAPSVEPTVEAPTPELTPKPTLSPTPAPTPASSLPLRASFDLTDEVVTAELASLTGRVEGAYRRERDQVQISIRREDTRRYWNGQRWQDGTIWLPAAVAETEPTWTLDAGAMRLTGGARYTLAARVTNPAYESSLTLLSFDYRPPFKGLTIKNLGLQVTEPGKPVVFFSLRDADNNAVVRPVAQLREGLLVLEEGQALDESEAGVSIKPASNLKLEVVLVLDFTASMRNAHAIDPMIDGAKALAEQLGAAHRVAIVEYHDRNEAPTLVQSLTADQALTLRNLEALRTRQNVVYGSTRAWDAAKLAADQFSAGNDVVRAMALLTDGRDTSSETTRAALTTLAATRRANVYPLAVGAAVDQKGLRELASATGGSYFAAENVADLRHAFGRVADNLTGQYGVSWVSLTAKAKFNAEIRLNLEGQTASLPLNGVEKLKTDDRIGILGIDKPQLVAEEARFIVRANHVPRQVDSLRFNVVGLPPGARVSPPQIFQESEGGIFKGWRLQSVEPDAWGYYTLASEFGELPFAADGPLFSINVAGVTAAQLNNIGVGVDNSRYPTGVKFACPCYARRGPEVALTQTLKGNVTEDAQPGFAGVARDAKGYVAIVNYRIDGGPWLPATPKDGRFDAASEDFTFKLPAGTLPASRAYLLEVEAQNEEGIGSNTLARYTFTYRGPWRLYDFAATEQLKDFQASGEPWLLDASLNCPVPPCLRSGVIPDSGFSTLLLPLADLPTGAKKVYFSVKVSSESGRDVATFSLGGVKQRDWSGETGWQRVEFDIPATRPITLEWRYTKDSAISSGKDAIWIDDIEFR